MVVDMCSDGEALLDLPFCPLFLFVHNLCFISTDVMPYLSLMHCCVSLDVVSMFFGPTCVYSSAFTWNAMYNSLGVVGIGRSLDIHLLLVLFFIFCPLIFIYELVVTSSSFLLVLTLHIANTSSPLDSFVPTHTSFSHGCIYWGHSGRPSM